MKITIELDLDNEFHQDVLKDIMNKSSNKYERLTENIHQIFRSYYKYDVMHNYLKDESKLDSLTKEQLIDEILKKVKEDIDNADEWKNS